MSKLKIQMKVKHPQYRVQGTYTFQQENIIGEDVFPNYTPQDQESEEMTRNKAMNYISKKAVSTFMTQMIGLKQREHGKIKGILNLWRRCYEK